MASMICTSIQNQSTISTVRSTHIYHAYRSNLPHSGLELFYVHRKNIYQHKGRQDGEGHPTTTIAELLVIATEEAPTITLDLEREKSSTWGGVGGDGGFGFRRRE
jgi:hypothetical protein